MARQSLRRTTDWERHFRSIFAGAGAGAGACAFEVGGSDFRPTMTVVTSPDFVDFQVHLDWIRRRDSRWCREDWPRLLWWVRLSKENDGESLAVETAMNDVYMKVLTLLEKIGPVERAVAPKRLAPLRNEGPRGPGKQYRREGSARR